MDNYAVIIHAISFEQLKTQIEILEKQKYTPNEYFIIFDKEWEPNKLLSIIEQLQHLAKQPTWLFKNLPPDETVELGVDELFKLDKVKSRYTLYINTYDIPLNLIQKIEEKFNKEIWFYNMQGFIFFGTVLCKYFYFDILEKSLIKNSFADRIYSEHTITEL